MAIEADDQQSAVRRALERVAGTEPDARAVADAASQCWLHVVACMEPVIGESGIAALHARCLNLRHIDAKAIHATEPIGQQRAPFGAAWQDIAARTPEDALNAAVAFFTTFITLLNSLIGAALTARLLNPVWADGPRDQPKRENPR